MEYLKLALQAAAKVAGVHPQEVTLSHLNKYDEKITSWTLRKFGGLTAVKKSFPLTTKDLVEIKQQKDVGSYIRDLENKLADKQTYEKTVIEAIKGLKTSIPKFKTTIAKPKKAKGKKNMAVELMLSDIHYGKLTSEFKLEVCRNRMRDLTKVFLSEVEQKQKTFNVNKIVLALIGDIIESYTMHGLESATSCEFGNSRQVQEAIESLFYDTLLPISSTGIDIIVPCVPGNHDRADIKKTMNMPGENNLSWIIYKMLESLAQAHKLKNVKFM